MVLFLMVPSFCLKNASGPNDVADVVGHIRSYIWSTDRYTALAPFGGVGGSTPNNIVPTLLFTESTCLFCRRRRRRLTFKLAAHCEDFEQLSVGNWLATFSVHD